MNFQLVSDLHIESRGGLKAPRSAFPTPISPMLIVAGDTYPAAAPEFKEIVRRLAEPFHLTLFVPGNHEYFGSKRPMTATDAVMRDACNSISNVVYFNKASLKLGHTTFMGATGWTNVPKSLWSHANEQMNDYVLIYNSSTEPVTPREIVAVHDDHVRWLKKTLAQAKRDKSKHAVVVTHHAPVEILSRDTVSRSASLFPFYYSSDMSDIASDPFINVWVHGHTHESHYIKLHPWGPTFACNARGYPEERTGYSENAVMRVT